MSGWIKLHRKVTEWEHYETPETFRVFVHLLLMAAHKKTIWKGVELNPGDVPTGRRKLSRKLNIKESVIRTCLKRLEKTNEIKILSNKKGSIVTIVNFSAYQIEEKPKRVVKPKPKKEVVIPTELEFLKHAKLKDSDFSLKRKNIVAKYVTWKDNGWKDGNDKPIKNWKIKLQNTLPYIKKEFKQNNQML